MPHGFDSQHVHHLTSSARREFLDPAQVLAPMGLTAGMTLADVGAGPGFFALEAARLVAPDGRVLAIDVSQDMLNLCLQRAAEAGLDNVETVLAMEPYHYPVSGAAADAVLLALVLHGVDAPQAMLRELRRIVKPGGEVLLVEWNKEETPMGPSLEQRLDPQEAIANFTAAGFALSNRYSAGPYHYALKFVLPKESA